MKKTFLLLLALLLILPVSACTEAPAELSPIEKCQQKAVSIGEQFLNYEITEEEAVEQLESLRVPETEGNGQLSLSVDINYLAFIIGKDLGGKATYEEIKEKVEWIRSRTYTDE